MNIMSFVIDNKKQRYPTIGDWTFDEEGNLHIKVSKMGDWRAESLVSIHEIVEAIICKHKGISQEEVDKFDIEFEKNNTEGEPGDDFNAPYYKAHQFANYVERQLATKLGLDWVEYEKMLQETGEKHGD